MSNIHIGVEQCGDGEGLSCAGLQESTEETQFSQINEYRIDSFCVVSIELKWICFDGK